MRLTSQSSLRWPHSPCRIDASWPRALQGVYSDPECANGGVVDRSMIVMGYNLNASPPYWIMYGTQGPSFGMNVSAGTRKSLIEMDLVVTASVLH